MSFINTVASPAVAGLDAEGVAVFAYLRAWRGHVHDAALVPGHGQPARRGVMLEQSEVLVGEADLVQRAAGALGAVA